MQELFYIQNDLLFGFQVVCFLAMLIAIARISIRLFRGEEVDAYLINLLVGCGAVLGFSYMIGYFKP
ncbi:hypothetical protein QE390_005066 [Siphonobacter sp. SORGH_AS 1065]|nr:hypothetical protein [Siphonobacter sp. SORGH_AS_1065]